MRPVYRSRGALTLDSPWRLAGHELPNRLVLAPLAGIGNWFVRLQARRYGAGLAVSEMISSFGLKYGDRRTHEQFLRLHPDEHPVSIQLFGHDADVMREAAAIVAEAGADLIDLNMGCPVRKVCKTGAGAALLDDPDKAVAIARAARRGIGAPCDRQAPVRTAPRRGERGPARTAADRRGRRRRDLFPSSSRLSATFRQSRLPARGTAGRGARRAGDPLRGSVAMTSTCCGPSSRPARRRSCSRAARSATRGCSSGCSVGAKGPPSAEEVTGELRWVIDRAEEHLGVERAGRYLRKFYPWYADTLGLSKAERQPLVTAPTTDDARLSLTLLSAPLAA